MKKIVFLLMALLLIGGNAIAQKKNVSLAKAKILSETPDTKAAKDAILPALKDSTTKNLANTWFVAGEVFYTIYKNEQKNLYLKPKDDKGPMGQACKSALSYYIVADSLDRLPDLKGKVKPKFGERIIERTTDFHRAFIEVGSYYYDQKDYNNSIDMFQNYLKYPSISFLKNKGFEKDTLRTLITYYVALSATQAEKPEIAVKYYEIVKDSIDSPWIYARLCEDYALLKDTADMIRMYQLGAAKFPAEQFYSRNLINYYINENLLNEAMTWIDAALKSDEKSSALWNVKGRILENDKKSDDAIICYEKALELDPNFADAMGNIGRIYYNHAVEELERVNAIKDDRTYLKEKAKMKALFDKPRPYFEKARAINPEERDYVIALRGIYYNLQMTKEYEAMDQALKDLTK
jgi:tetratricopeptide (TPR) repeat protein